MPLDLGNIKSANTIPADSSVSSNKLASGAVTLDKLGTDAVIPRISTIEVTDSSWTVLDDTAVDTSGGYIKITGSGFLTGCNVVIGTTTATSVTVVNSTTLRVQVPALSAATYNVYAVNTDGGTGTKINGLTYSALPSWVTSSSLSATSGVAFSTQLSATEATSYALVSGSSLPTGATLTSGGLLSGTITVANPTTYNFTINAVDAQNQDSQRAFSLAVSTLAGIRCRYMRIVQTSTAYGNHTVWQLIVKGNTDANGTQRFLFNDSAIRSAITAPAASWGNGFAQIDGSTGAFQTYFRNTAGLASGGYYYYISDANANISYTFDFTTAFPTICEVWISGVATNGYTYYNNGYVQFSLNGTTWSNNYALTGANAYNDIPPVVL